MLSWAFTYHCWNPRRSRRSGCGNQTGSWCSYVKGPLTGGSVTRSGSEEETAKVGRTLGHQDPNLGLGIKARHCPGSRQVWWARLQILAEEARPRQSPRLTTQANHRRSYSELGLTVTQGSQEPFSSKGPELEGNKGEQEIGLQVFPARCPGFLVSLLDVGTESCHHQSEELESDSWLHYLTAWLTSPLGCLRNIQVYHGQNKTSGL